MHAVKCPLHWELWSWLHSHKLAASWSWDLLGRPDSTNCDPRWFTRFNMHMIHQHTHYVKYNAYIVLTQSYLCILYWCKQQVCALDFTARYPLELVACISLMKIERSLQEQLRTNIMFVFIPSYLMQFS